MIGQKMCLVLILILVLISLSGCSNFTQEKSLQNLEKPQTPQSKQSEEKEIVENSENNPVEGKEPINEGTAQSGDGANQLDGEVAQPDEDLHKLHDEVAKPEEDMELFFERPQTKPGSTLIKVFKEKRVLELYGDDKIIGRFKIGLGGNPKGDKEKEGDKKTPEGLYYVCVRNDKSRFYLSLGVSYPNVKDAKRGLESGLIDDEIFAQIQDAQQRKQMPPWNTPLGGAICIHGGGNFTDWTDGCVALNNEDMDIVWEYCPIKTPIEIYE